ncbi:outer membrane beta-barrel protein [Echinicola jeungdonensis]|uniref:Outer membrane beta-barrel protein n=1 Tax=Echinicola jeungdonensis TaxID=709343 RepID=A0ABV5J3P4_9BACT|nr:outer membrane beta-barrel protein [Echinicola jeungdonensis]MDN3668445.1 outer membrane beta-barrel protein [Echinicola jeungdonensis]
MKKTLMIILFMALAQSLWAFDQTPSHSTQDSIIIEYGQRGKIVILVDNKEDFEKLKKLDINQIINELDLEIDPSTGELKMVKSKELFDSENKEILRVEESGGEIIVSMGKLKIIVDESGPDTKVKVEKKKDKDPSFRQYFHVDLGINNYLEEGDIPTSDQPYSVKGWGSWQVGLNWMASQRLSKGFYWDFGLGVHWYNFKFENKDYQAIIGADNIEFIQRNDVEGIKSKISASYITAMTLLKLNFAKINDEENRGLSIAIGPYLGYRVGGRSKYVFHKVDGNGREKVKITSGLYLENLRYGLRSEIGLGQLTFFSSYDFNSLFQDGKGPSNGSIQPIIFGVVF